MKIKNLILYAFVAICLSSIAAAQNLKRTISKVERADLGAGGTVSIVGAPVGSIEITGWQKPEVEIAAEIQIEAANENDLATLAKINNFVIDADMNHIRVFSTGIDDREFLKKSYKKLPKTLIGLPYRIDYKIKIPAYTDLDINHGKGDFALRGVEGVIVIKSLEAARANLDLTGGTLIATFGGGSINININARSWRGRNAEIQLARGEMNVNILPNFNGDFDLSVLRTGKIENTFDNLKPRDRTKFEPNSIYARAGVGGAKMTFTVGDGTLRFAPLKISEASNDKSNEN